MISKDPYKIFASKSKISNTIEANEKFANNSRKAEIMKYIISS